ncbi:deoxyribonuclease V [Litchfieldella xinjiangensis]|uniref:deoxyribonuclease V n=1 Tax=Litchfieldella xinjiangensis TaxID=1166948 RepID=UPI0005BB66D4|nr:deoxyribonuclease V [Halomonas xinjiangensis]
MDKTPLTPLHEWTPTPDKAIALQRELAPRVEREDRIGEVNLIAGVDIGFEQEGAITRAAVVLLDWPSLTLVDHVIYREPTRMPYIPGLLSFREIPAALEAFNKLSATPDLVMVDGQGIAHPRRLGVASHLGLWLDLPTIGVAKSILCGRHDEVPEQRGGWTPLSHRGEVIGAALRSREKVKPIFISSGHRVSLETSLDWVVRCLGRTKLPEPTRLADRLASRRGAMPAASS